MLRKTGGVIGKLDTSCQRRLERVIERFCRTSELPGTLGDALVWHPFCYIPCEGAPVRRYIALRAALY